MTVVFICGDKNDRSFRFLLKNVLAKTYTVTYIGGDLVFRRGNGYEVVAIDFETFDKIETKEPIFLLKKDCVPNFAFPENSTAIACSENEEQIKALKNSPCRIITCGFGKTDSFSYSSLSDEETVVSLNRELTAFSGKKIQPLEIPTEIPRGQDLYSVIAFTALRILLDDFNSEIGELI